MSTEANKELARRFEEVFDRRLELRVERIGATERLRLTGTEVALTAPFAAISSAGTPMSSVLASLE